MNAITEKSIIISEKAARYFDKLIREKQERRKELTEYVENKIKHDEMKNKSISEMLKEHFDNTSKEEVITTWESTSVYDDVNSPSMKHMVIGEIERG